ncbi:hypothetical protein [Mariniflexile maritimum]|uniref:hypothetical protein n=1 Tax=Mariniflexile maritimum TaxID=2682493 RepID=UPI0012F64156|nr:hypothetical protein [Mariniflexile maritimum]
MENSINYSLNFTTNADKVSATIDKLEAKTLNIKEAAIKVNTAFVNSLNSINTKLDAVRLDALINNIQHVTTGLNSLSQPGLKLSSSLADASAIYNGATGWKGSASPIVRQGPGIVPSKFYGASFKGDVGNGPIYIIGRGHLMGICLWIYRPTLFSSRTH